MGKRTSGDVYLAIYHRVNSEQVNLKDLLAEQGLKLSNYQQWKQTYVKRLERMASLTSQSLDEAKVERFLNDAFGDQPPAGKKLADAKPVAAEESIQVQIHPPAATAPKGPRVESKKCIVIITEVSQLSNVLKELS